MRTLAIAVLLVGCSHQWPAPAQLREDPERQLAPIEVPAACEMALVDGECRPPPERAWRVPADHDRVSIAWRCPGSRPENLELWYTGYAFEDSVRIRSAAGTRAHVVGPGSYHMDASGGFHVGPPVGWVASRALAPKLDPQMAARGLASTPYSPPVGPAVALPLILLRCHGTFAQVEDSLGRTGWIEVLM